jgi:hypothetical protein
MRFSVSYIFPVFVILSSFVTGCYLTTDAKKPQSYALNRVFPADAKSSVTFDRSIIASPLVYVSNGRPLVIVPVSNGEIGVLDGKTGVLVWKINAPTPEGQEAELISTPVIVNDRLVIIYQCLENGIRTSHRMAVIDLAKEKLDETFPILTLSAEKPASDGATTVKFNPPTAYSHSALKHAPKPGSVLGRVYASFGNAGDTQPFHGWMFEIDMDAWLKQGVKYAVSHVLLTTPETKCPSTLEYGTQEMICGGGIWTPGGPQLYPTDESFEIFVPTGNGQVDLARHDYANSVMRVQPDLTFDDGCDKKLCKDFQPKQPNRDCIASCKNLFIPRPPPDNLGLKPSNRECDDKTFGECLAWMDYDLGASTPVKAKLKNGQHVLVQPGKEGAVYLIDADHLGTQHDRIQLVDVCGTPTDTCIASWMGMIVTQPVLAYIDDEPIIIIPAFVPDKTHPAGVFALTVVLENGAPKLKQVWHKPDKASGNAVLGFRSHPSLPVISEGFDKEPIVWVVDIGAKGILYGIRVKDGTMIVEQSLLGAGRQLSAPVIYENIIYLASIMPTTGKTFVEAYRISTNP